jgi:hypothetical protein
MGNLCGKESADPFAQPGRTLGSAPALQTTSSVPASKKIVVGGPPRTLGGSVSSSTEGDAKANAAAAAEVC